MKEKRKEDGKKLMKKALHQYNGHDGCIYSFTEGSNKVIQITGTGKLTIYSITQCSTMKNTFDLFRSGSH